MNSYFLSVIQRDASVDLAIFEVLDPQRLINHLGRDKEQKLKRMLDRKGLIIRK